MPIMKTGIQGLEGIGQLLGLYTGMKISEKHKRIQQELQAALTKEERANTMLMLEFRQRFEAEEGEKGRELQRELQRGMLGKKEGDKKQAERKAHAADVISTLPKEVERLETQYTKMEVKITTDRKKYPSKADYEKALTDNLTAYKQAVKRMLGSLGVKFPKTEGDAAGIPGRYPAFIGSAFDEEMGMANSILDINRVSLGAANALMAYSTEELHPDTDISGDLIKIIYGAPGKGLPVPEGEGEPVTKSTKYVKPPDETIETILKGTYEWVGDELAGVKKRLLSKGGWGVPAGFDKMTTHAEKIQAIKDQWLGGGEPVYREEQFGRSPEEWEATLRKEPLPEEEGAPSYENLMRSLGFSPGSYEGMSTQEKIRLYEDVLRQRSRQPWER